MAEPFVPDPSRLVGLQGRNKTFYDMGRRDMKRAVVAGLRAYAATATPGEVDEVIRDVVRLIETADSPERPEPAG